MRTASSIRLQSGAKPKTHNTSMNSEPVKKYGGPTPGQPRKPVKDINSLPEGFLKECLEYNPETGVLKWAQRPLHHFPSAKQCAAWNATWAGKEAGSKKCRKRSDHRSTIQICISKELPQSEWTTDDDGRVRRSKSILYSAHRLAFVLMGESVPVDKVIDHINNDPWDNRWCNLRLSSQQENMRNRGASHGKKSGLPRNVFLRPHSSQEFKYEARVCVGAYPTVEQALEARNKAEITLFGKILHREDQ